MENYINELEKLLNLIHDKKTNKKTLNEFCTAWENLVQNEGYSEKAEEYLMKGSVLAGATPFMDWVAKQNNQKTALGKLLGGKQFGKDRDKALRLLLSALACIANSPKLDNRLFLFIAMQVPRYGNGKNAPTIARKYFMENLTEAAKLPELDENDRANLAEFAKTMGKLLQQETKKPSPSKTKKTFPQVLKWLSLADHEAEQKETVAAPVPQTGSLPHAGTLTNQSTAESNTTISQIVPNQPIDPQKYTYPSIVTAKGTKAEPAIKGNQPKKPQEAREKKEKLSNLGQLEKLLQQSGKTLSELKNELEEKESKNHELIRSLIKELDTSKNKLQQEQLRREATERFISEKNQVIANLNSKIAELEKQLKDSGEALDTLSVKIEDLNKLKSSGEENYRSNKEEFINRIRSGLKRYYDELQELEQQDNNDTRKIFISKMKRMFKVLNENGIQFELR